MPELPEVEIKRKYLENAALNREITDIDILDTQILKNISPDKFIKVTKHHHPVATHRHGKYLFVKLDSGRWMIVHFGMTGDFQIIGQEEELPRFSKVAFVLENKKMLCYTNMRKLGWLGMTENPDDIIVRKKLGPDALEVTLDDFLKRMQGRSGLIKPLLLNQNLIAGLGNLYADEVLFQTGIHPLTPADRLNSKQIEAIYQTIRKVLNLSIELKTDFSIFPENYMLRYRRNNRMCPAGCGEFQTIKIGGRTAYFCPQCQKLK